MALFIGPMHEDSQMKKPKEDSKDIFMWMAKLLKDENIVPDFTVRGTNMAAGTYKKCVVYLNPDFSLDENNANYITDSNYRNYISLTPTTTITEKWSCWIMASDVSKWWDYAGKYDVPEGQTATTFAFTALNGERQGGTTKLNQGNLLDDIRFSIAYPLLVSTTTGGQGTVTAQGLDADGEVVNRVEVKYNQDHDNDYVDGTHVTISAIPNPKDLNQEFVFLGANVDGVYVPARNLDGTYNTKDYTITEDKTQFSLNIIMDRPHAVQLIFFAKGKIIYDPNGGTYNGNKEPTMVNMSAGGEDITTSGNTFDKTKNYQKWDNPIGDAIPSDSENMNFIGWFFARGNSNKGGIIKSDHTVVYDGNTGIDDNTIDKFNVTYTTGEGTDEKTETVEVKYGITFIAQYEYLQKDIAQTAKTDNIGSTDKIVYENSIDGGTVSLSIKDFDDKSDTGTAGTDIEYGEGANCGQKGFGRLRDTVTMTATANSGYTFMGWYDESGNLVQHGKTLVYNVDKAHTYYARFKKNEGIRYVSFVAESNENSMPSDTPFSEGSHVRGYIYTVAETDKTADFTEIYNKPITERIGGNDWFGNTISTGFTVSKAVTDTATEIKWKITIPTDENTDKDLNTYVKIRDNNPTTLFTYDQDNPVLADTVLGEKNYFNRGKIYRATGAASTAYIGEITAISANDAIWEYYGLGSAGDAVGDSDISSDETDFIDDENGGAEAETDGEISEEVDEFENVPEEDFGVFENPFAEEMNLATLNENGDIEIKLKRTLNTVISGSTTLVYGLVIDNLYAPRALVDISLNSTEEGFTSIDNIDDKTDSQTSEGYRNDNSNPYSRYEKGISPISD